MASYSTGSEINRNHSGGQVAAHQDNFGRESNTEKKTDISIEKANTLESNDVEKTALPATAEVVYDDDGEEHYSRPAETAKDLVTEVIHVRDDPSLNPWTFRVWFLGIGLSIFGGILSTIYYFKPQNVSISVVFLAVISLVLGELMAFILPRRGFLGRLLNPHPFNSKEHAAIIVMGSAAANAPLAVEVLAVQRLYYDIVPSAAVAIFLVWSSQTIGYGFAGLMRRVLVYPTKMLYPWNLPINSALEALHGPRREVRKKLRVFYIGFFILFIYEMLPAYIMPVLVGVNFFCLANQNSLVFTNFFGGSNGNEGMGILSLSFDWQYIANPSPLWYPLQTLFNNFIGYLLCIITFAGVYYGNVWKAQSFPFLSQAIYSENGSNGTDFAQYNQTAVLNSNYEVDLSLLGDQGLPYFASTTAVNILSTNMAIAATFTHLLLWNYGDIKDAWDFLRPSKLKNLFNPKRWKFWDQNSVIDDDKETDPHYRLMLAYKDAPNWWYGLLLISSLTIGMAMIYVSKSTLPWWSFLIATLLLSPACVLFFGAQFAITGFNFNTQPVVQMIAGYIHPGRPMANMYFVLFGYNSVFQGQLLLRDLKFGQYAHLPPRVTFTMQLLGTVIGSIASYLIMVSVTTNQREVLLSIEGTNVWSGANVQMFNSQAIAWGGFANELFSAGKRYQWVTYGFLIGFVAPLPFWVGHKFFPKLRLDYVNTALITIYVGLLNIGINSVTTAWFVIGAFSQFYLRKYRPNWFIKYNYILSAAMEGGTQVLIFILSFAVFGGATQSHPFPPYWGNNFQNGNLDYCKVSPGTKGGGS